MLLAAKEEYAREGLPPTALDFDGLDNVKVTLTLAPTLTFHPHLHPHPNPDPNPDPTLTLTLTKATGFCWLKNSSYTAAAQNRSKGLISGRMASNMPAAVSAKLPPKAAALASAKR